MILAVLTIPAIILLIILFFTYKSIAKYKNGMLFAVTLPAHAIEHPELQAIQKNYNKSFNRAFLLLCISYLPFLFLSELFAFQFIYYLLWMTLSFVFVIFPYRKAFRATLNLKRQHDWFVGEKRIIHADLRAAQLKNKSALSPKQFIIPIAISLLLTVWLGNIDTQLYWIGISSLSFSLLMFVIVLLLRRSKATVYSDNSDINVALNQFHRRSIFLMFFWLAMMENLHFYLIAQMIMNENEQMSSLWLLLTTGFTILPVAFIFFTYQRISSTRREMLELEGNPIYSDDDEYWANGFTYHNPYDKSIFVPKRVGVGEAVNTGTLVGKMIIGGAFGTLAVVLIGVSFMMIRSELTSPKLLITEQAEISIDYPMYSYTFHLNEIEELTLVDSIPSGAKSNGEATSKYARGHFRLKELGKTRLYVFRDNAPYIRIKLPDQYIFYNDADPNETTRLYEELNRMLQ